MSVQLPPDIIACLDAMLHKVQTEMEYTYTFKLTFSAKNVKGMIEVRGAQVERLFEPILIDPHAKLKSALRKEVDKKKLKPKEKTK